MHFTQTEKFLSSNLIWGVGKVLNCTGFILIFFFLAVFQYGVVLALVFMALLASGAMAFLFRENVSIKSKLST